MKKILGLDLGTTSIGWAYVNEAENKNEKSAIKKLGVRVIPLSTDEETDFQKGKSISINADRTLKRSARRNLDRYQLRRNNLIEILTDNKFINDKTILSEEGKQTTFTTYEKRAKAVSEKISKEDFAKILLMINKKRGYKSSRKAQSDDEGTAIDGMGVAKYLYENKSTPGQYVYDLLKNDKKYIPDFYRSDLQNELDKIWEYQKHIYTDILSTKLKDDIKGMNKGATWTILKEPFNIQGIKIQGKAKEQKLEKYRLRTIALTEKIDLEYLAIVLQEINNQINQSSGYLGAISDRSKELYFNKQTVGQYLYNQLKENPHARLKNQVFYRQDYLDEFETIWEKQKEYYPELTEELKHEIRDVIVFYQRRLKSQKHLISECEFEKHHKVVPKSSPLFQEFKIWQLINNIEFKHKPTRTIYKNDDIELETKEILYNELNIRDKLNANDILKILVKKPKEYELNYKDGIEGNRTNAELYKVYQEILKREDEDYDFKKLRADKINDIVVSKFAELGIKQEILSFNSDLTGNKYDKQPIIQLWHLLYSFEGDNSRTGDEKLIIAIEKKFGIKKEYAKLFTIVKLQSDYGSLSSKAIRKILPFLKAGNKYDVACSYTNYNHSASLTKEEQETRELKDSLDLLPKNSLRNPVVEKILNQLVNVVNAIIKDDKLGKPDEIRVELARELKKSAKERAEMSSNINKATAKHQKIRKILQSEFGITKVTRNDIIRFKLWEELESNGYKTIYTNTYIPKDKIFSKEFDIEHIIPKALIFDDSFSNKTLTVRQVNIDKSNETAFDFLKQYLNNNEFNQYLARVESLFKNGKISKAKYNKLLIKASEIPEGFIERDLRNSQYIAKKATQMLSEVVRDVNTTSGSITDRLRSDWQLINTMKELNLPKYEKLGLVKTIEGKNGQPEKQIINWTKRNDHRHHAMDALTVAFTKPAFIQYLNNLHTRVDKTSSIYGIEQKNLHRDKNGKLVFNPPIPIKEFREDAKKHLESILISYKAKNKVVTRNKNKIKVKGGLKEKIQLTPRGQMHKETIYGKIEQYATKEEKIGANFNLEKIKLIAKQEYREALLVRLADFEGDPKKAFTGKNALSKKPIYLNSDKTETVPDKLKLVWLDPQYTIRKDISPDLKIEKVIDTGVKNILRNRLKEYNNDAKKAFINLEENPIWLNKEKGISIKRVTIKGVNNVEVLHYKKDHNGNLIYDNKGNKQAVDFVSTGNNHHVAIYRDQKGNLQEEVVSFYEAVHRVNEGLPIINKNKVGLEFLFTMKQNEYFVFPSENFDPSEIDLLNPENASIISPQLFRVQKFTIKDYFFRHHLETSVDNIKETKHFAWKREGINGITGIIKVRINHLGQIVKVGE
jgi:CRISPR-associated endonuclease Csn1